MLMKKKKNASNTGRNKEVWKRYIAKFIEDYYLEGGSEEEKKSCK